MLKPTDRVKQIKIGKLLEEQLIGKTIRNVSARAVNRVELEFEDGSELRLEAELLHSMGLCGIIGYVRK